MGKFWKFTGKTMQYFNRTLRQVQKNSGEIGGWIENEKSLPQTGNCWLDENSKIHGRSKLSGKVTLFGTEVINSVLNDCAGVTYTDCVFFNSKISYTENPNTGLGVDNTKYFNVSCNNFSGADSRHGNIILTINSKIFLDPFVWDCTLSIKNSEICASVGCQTHSIKAWKKIYSNFAEEYEMDKKTIDAGLKLLESAPTLKANAEQDLHNYFHKFGQPRTNGKFVKAPKYF